MANNACSQPCQSHQPEETPLMSPVMQVRSDDVVAQSEACNVSFNVWVKPSSESDEDDTASSSSSGQKSADDLLRCNEEIDDDNVSISSKRPPISSEGRPTKRMRATNLPAVKDASPLPQWDILSFTLMCA